MRFLIVLALVTPFLNVCAQKKTLPSYDASPYFYKSIDSISVNTYMDKAMFEMSEKN